MSMLLTVLAFVAGFLLIFGVNMLMLDFLTANRRQVRRRLEEEFRERGRQRARRSLSHAELHDEASSETFSRENRPSLGERVEALVEQSGLNVRPVQLILLTIGLSAAAGALCAMSGSLVLAALGAAGTAVLPILYVALVRARRMEKLLSQLPDAFDLMARALRAGQTMSQALQSVADEFSAPVAEEFGVCYEQQNLGLSPEAAMRDLARRTGLLEIKIFVLAVVVHRQTGGNLADLLEKLAAVIRDRYRIRGIIKALTAEGRLQAIILLALPPAMLVIMFVINRPYAMVLFQYPLFLVVMFATMAIGGLWIRKIISYDF